MLEAFSLRFLKKCLDGVLVSEQNPSEAKLNRDTNPEQSEFALNSSHVPEQKDLSFYAFRFTSFFLPNFFFLFPLLSLTILLLLFHSFFLFYTITVSHLIYNEIYINKMKKKNIIKYHKCRPRYCL